MAITQMEAMVSNPSQLRMAADQMRNMSEGNLKRQEGAGSDGDSGEGAGRNRFLSSSGGGPNNEVDDEKSFVSLLPRVALLYVQVGRASGHVFTWLSHAT